MKQYSTFHFLAYSWNHPASSARASRSRDYAEIEFLPDVSAKSSDEAGHRPF